MELSSPESIKALEIALEKEKLAREIYENISQNSMNSGTSAVADILAGEEKKHFVIISGLIEDIRENRPKRTGEKSSVDPKKILVGALDNIPIHPDKNSEDTKRLLKKALEKEKQSFEFYLNAAKEVNDKTAEGIFYYLAGEENKHYIMVDNLIDFISAPGRWLYTEENQIYHL